MQRGELREERHLVRVRVRVRVRVKVRVRVSARVRARVREERDRHAARQAARGELVAGGVVAGAAEAQRLGIPLQRLLELENHLQRGGAHFGEPVYGRLADGGHAGRATRQRRAARVKAELQLLV